MEINGFLKGSYVNANNLMHITGIDNDFEAEKIEVTTYPFIVK